MAVIFAYDNKAEGATITSSSEVASLPDNNVITYWKSKVWRTTGDAAEWIKFDLGSAQNIQFIALVGHNLTSAAVVHIQAHATDVWTTPSRDVTLTYNADILLYYWAANQSYRWWRFTFADGANPDTYIEVGHILIGDVWEPDRNAVGFTYQYVDPSEVSESPDGAESADVKEPFLVMSLDFKRIDTDDLDTMIRDVGMNKRFYVMPDYGNAIKTDGLHDFTRYGRFISLGSSPWQFKKKYDRTLVFQEARQ